MESNGDSLLNTDSNTFSWQALMKVMMAAFKAVHRLRYEFLRAPNIGTDLKHEWRLMMF